MENQKNKISLHVHLAEGKSNSEITNLEFDNFCYDIICLEHFMRHLKDYLRSHIISFEDIVINCEYKMSDVLRISMITVEMPMYKCELQIRKHIVRGEFEKYYKTNL